MLTTLFEIAWVSVGALAMVVLLGLLTAAAACVWYAAIKGWQVAIERLKRRNRP